MSKEIAAFEKSSQRYPENDYHVESEKRTIPCDFASQLFLYSKLDKRPRNDSTKITTAHTQQTSTSLISMEIYFSFSFDTEKRKIIVITNGRLRGDEQW